MPTRRSQLPTQPPNLGFFHLRLILKVGHRDLVVVKDRGEQALVVRQPLDPVALVTQLRRDLVQGLLRNRMLPELEDQPTKVLLAGMIDAELVAE